MYWIDAASFSPGTHCLKNHVLHGEQKSQSRGMVILAKGVWNIRSIYEPRVVKMVLCLAR